MNIPVVLAIVIGLFALGLLVIFLVIKRRDQIPTETNYRAFFIIGLSWLAIGIPLKNPGLYGMGVVFTIVGLVNRDKWGQERGWSDLSTQERRLKLFLVIGLTILLLLGVAAYFIYGFLK
jgi:hypothetical protein